MNKLADNEKEVLMTAKELEKYGILLSPELFADMLIAEKGERISVPISEIERMNKELNKRKKELL